MLRTSSPNVTKMLTVTRQNELRGTAEGLKVREETSQDLSRLARRSSLLASTRWLTNSMKTTS